MEKILKKLRAWGRDDRDMRELSRIARQRRNDVTLATTVAPTNAFLARTNGIEERLRKLA